MVLQLEDGVKGHDEIVQEQPLRVAIFLRCMNPCYKELCGEGVLTTSVGLPMYLHVQHAMKVSMVGKFSNSALTISFVICCSFTLSLP